MSAKPQKNILWFEDIFYKDLPLVGGKNASLGEMYRTFSRQGINIPNGFALTSKGYWYFIKANRLDEKLKRIFAKFNPGSLASLRRTGRLSRNLILKADFPDDLEKEIFACYRKLSKKYHEKTIDVAVRSSGTYEDLPEASFAGQFETMLNVRGEKELLKAMKRCLASLFNDRAISYTSEKGFPHLEIALSVGVQKMVRSDLSSSGVIFTLDTESGFPGVVLINSIWGVGEMIVQGKIVPDEFYVFKPTLHQGFKPIIVRNLGRKDKKYIYAHGGGLKEIRVRERDRMRFSLSDADALRLARWACLIEKHYRRPQDIEWAKDGKTKQLFIVQSRPETVHAIKAKKFYEEYEVKTSKKPLFTGIAVGNKVGQGPVRIIPDVLKISGFRKGEVLVTRMTDPDWVPALRMASAVITEEGGRTCHAAIVSRELGIPAIVGTKIATKTLKTGQMVTVDCTQGQGKVFAGKIPFKIKRYDLKRIPALKTKVMVNIGAPEIAFQTSFLPVKGVGLARIEFILAEKIRIHPLALYHFGKLKDIKLKKHIETLTRGYRDKKEYFIEKLSEGIAQIAAAFYPEPVIVRLSDLKTNEYRTLIGGEAFEPEESNPMLGWRGASRYYDRSFQPAFEMECRAIKKVRETFGLKNIWPMVPFCRTPEEGRKILGLMAKNGLARKRDGLKVIVMCEIPSNVVLAEEFLDIFDGMSIGSNDLTQLILGIDRDNAKIAYVGDERNKAVKEMISRVIKLCRARKKYCGICGQAPSDYLEFARFLQREGIESISLNPDTVIKTILNLAKLSQSEARRKS